MDVIEGVLPAHEVSILAGASGAGKTTLTMQIVKALKEGEPIFGHHVRAGLKLGYIVADRTLDAYHRLAAVVGVDLRGLKVRSLIDDTNISTRKLEENPLSLLFDLLKDLLPVDVVVVDPLVIFFGCDTNKYHQNGSRLIQLNRWCKQNHVTLLGTHHATKARSDYTFKRPQDRISGSSALLGFTSTQLFLAAPDETGEPHHQWFIISHHAPAETISLKRNDRGTFDHVDPLNLEATYALNLLQHLPASGEAIPRKQLLPKAPSSATLDRWLKVLESHGLVVRKAHGHYARATRQ